MHAKVTTLIILSMPLNDQRGNDIPILKRDTMCEV